MSTSTALVPFQPQPPRVETLLNAAYRDRAALRIQRTLLVRVGVGDEHLPDETVMTAFALLGDHGRADLVKELRADWPRLQAGGVVQGSLDDAPTPTLRMVLLALDMIGGLDDILRQLADVGEAPEAPPEVLRCSDHVQGLWGQEAHFYFSAHDAAYVRIGPDRVFGLQPALVAADETGWIEGSFVFPIDNGVITISVMRRDGEVFRKIVRVETEGARA